MITKLPSMRLLVFTIAAVVGGLATSPAHACRVNLDAAERINLAKAETVVLVSVLRAAYTGVRGPDWRPWNGTVRLERVLRGQTVAKRFPIGRSGSTAACDDGIPPPRAGDRWVLYLGTSNGEETVRLAYPLAVAHSADPNLPVSENVR